MNGQTPGQAAYEAYGERVRASQLDPDGLRPQHPWDAISPISRDAWEVAVKAGHAAIAAQEQPAPELAAVLADRYELSGLNAWQGAEINRLREALEQVAKHHDDDIAQVRIVAKIARRALEGKPQTTQESPGGPSAGAEQPKGNE